jgi:hypothetical protein
MPGVLGPLRRDAPHRRAIGESAGECQRSDGDGLAEIDHRADSTPFVSHRQGG